jgi:hypothetical protein
LAAERRDVHHKDGSNQSTLERLFDGKRVTDDEIWNLNIKNKRDLERRIKESFPDMSMTIQSRRITTYWPRIRNTIQLKSKESGPGMYVACHRDMPVSYVAADSRIAAERILGILFAAIFEDLVIYKESSTFSEIEARQQNISLREKYSEDIRIIDEQIASLALKAESIRYVQDICDTLTRA